jgi:hypothetical protein
MPQPPSVYIAGVKNISPFIQLLEQITKQQYEIKALSISLKLLNATELLLKLS